MRKFGLLGKKLSHSLSPLLHNIFFEDLGLNNEYKLYEVEESEVENFKSYMLENSIEGVNITVPYKKVFLDKLDYISDEAKEIGAINLLYIKDNKFYGDNTDYYGFKYTLEKNQVDVKNQKVIIIGKGGASASVYKVLKDMGAEDITFYFRKDKLSKIEFPENTAGDIIINTTPVGMYPFIQDSLVNKEILKKFKIAIDLIYNPLETKFLKEAKECGLKNIMKIMVINGPNLNMLGIREQNIYGTFTYEDLCKYIKNYPEFNGKNIEFEFLQSNVEGEIVNFIQGAYSKKSEGIILNAGAYTHTSVAIHDAIKAVSIPTVEVHISNIHSRENFRKVCITTPACIGQITGLGKFGYILAIVYLIEYYKERK